MAAMGGSSSAPQLSQSPYASALSTASRPKKPPGKWTPPPGAFNNPDLPQFAMPGPGRYTPATSSTKPRIVGARFGSEDRFKYLSPQTAMETTSSGMMSGFCPQSSSNPGPGYMPRYDLVHTSSRKSAFSVERRDTSGIGAGSGASIAPGPGLYTPSDKSNSMMRNYTPGGAFLADDRNKYLGQVDADSGTVRQTYGPGPNYNPADHLAKPRAPTVAFGGRGPGTIKKPPSLKTESPGPGSYDLGRTMADGAIISSKRRAPAPGFGSSTRGDSAFVDSTKCYHGKVAIDMTNANNINASPGPAYHPPIDGVKAVVPRATFGTAKRTTPGIAPVGPMN